jgi:hypothetical protein
MNDDDNPFGLDFEVEGSSDELPLGLYVGAPVPSDEVEIVELAHRNAHRCAHMVIFTTPADDDPDVEIFDNAAQWQAALEFPRPPTIAEALDPSSTSNHTGDPTSRRRARDAAPRKRISRRRER